MKGTNQKNLLDRQEGSICLFVIVAWDPWKVISNERKNERTYLVTDFVTENRYRRKIEGGDHQAGQKRQFKKSKSAYQLILVAILKGTGPVNDLFQKAAGYDLYLFVKQLEMCDDDLAHELHCMAKKTAVQMMDRILLGNIPCQILSSCVTIGSLWRFSNTRKERNVYV